MKAERVLFSMRELWWTRVCKCEEQRIDAASVNRARVIEWGRGDKLKLSELQ